MRKVHKVGRAGKQSRKDVRGTKSVKDDAKVGCKEIKGV